MSTRLSVLVAAIAACSGSSDRQKGSAQPEAAAKAEPAPAAKPTTAETGGLGAPKIPWKDKTHAQRLEYMGLFVLDKMGALFAEWRPDDYAEKGAWRCQTCHGENFDKPPVSFHMPRVAYRLDAKDPFGNAMMYKADAAQFMRDKVVPAMADLLSEEPIAYQGSTVGSATGTFGCFRCHPKTGEKLP
jgi:hypothetical protein